MEARAPGGAEVVAEHVRIVMPSAEEPAIQVNGRALSASLDSILTHRHLSLRHPRVNAVFHIEAALHSGFRHYLDGCGFTEVFTPKIVSGGTGGGAEVFELGYFDKTAYLAQSPQFYKQTLVGSGFERICETGHAYRAEEHSTSRHLNEYVSLDIEMGFIESSDDPMALEERLIPSMFQLVSERCVRELATLGDAHEERSGGPFVFVTDNPRSKRPMYARPLIGESSLTDSFDLLYRGLEVTTGGMRIHEYEALRQSIRAKGLDPAMFETYLAASRRLRNRP